jgi:hypothetical protein
MILESVHTLRYAKQPLITVGFHAPKGTGKDTTTAELIRVLEKEHIYGEQSAMADPLYQALSVLTGLPVAWLQDQRNKNRPLTEMDTPVRSLWGKFPRHLLEIIGTEVVRNQIAPDHFVEMKRDKLTKCGGRGARAKIAERSAKLAQNTPWHFITDIRFPNETTLCDVVIELRRTGCEYGGEKDHVSSRRLPDELIDRTLHLTDRTEDFYRNLTNMIAAEVIHCISIDQRSFREGWCVLQREREAEEYTSRIAKGVNVSA